MDRSRQRGYLDSGGLERTTALALVPSAELTVTELRDDDGRTEAYGYLEGTTDLGLPEGTVPTKCITGPARTTPKVTTKSASLKAVDQDVDGWGRSAPQRRVHNRRLEFVVERMITSVAVSKHRAATSEAPTPRTTERDLERAATRVLAANERLRRQLDAYDLVIAESLEKYRTGMALLDVVRTMPPADATIGSELEVIEVFDERRLLRRALVVTLLDEGMAVEELARSFNITVESVCDIANEVGKPIE